MKNRRLLLAATFLAFYAGPASGQLETSYPGSAVLYKVLIDDPSIQNNLWVHLQPLTADGMAMNAVVGSGLEAHWVSPFRGLEVHGAIRGNFFNAMDMQKRASSNAAVFLQEAKYDDPSQNPQGADFSRFYAWELGAFYPFLEKTSDGKANIAVPDPSGTAENLELNARILRSFGVRLGLNAINTTVAIDKALKDQNIELTGSRGTRLLPGGESLLQGSTLPSPAGRNNLFSSFSSTGFYAGVAMQRRKNISIKTETIGIISSNSIITFYADLLVNPWTELRPFHFNRQNTGEREDFNTDAVNLSKIGFRTGFEIRYNEASFMSAGGEIGYRPAIQGQGFFASLRIGIPVFSAGKGLLRKPSTNVGADQSIGK